MTCKIKLETKTRARHTDWELEKHKLGAGARKYKLEASAGYEPGSRG